MPATLSPLTLPGASGCIPISEHAFLIYLAPTLADTRGELTTIGPWCLPVRYVAPCVSYIWGPHSAIVSVTLYGMRTLTALRESGYQLEGRVSIGGKKYRGFTSSQLWQLPDGRLLETATIHACFSA